MGTPRTAPTPVASKPAPIISPPLPMPISIVPNIIDNTSPSACPPLAYFSNPMNSFGSLLPIPSVKFEKIEFSAPLVNATGAPSV
jgi:hypothetical protein